MSTTSTQHKRSFSVSSLAGSFQSHPTSDPATPSNDLASLAGVPTLIDFVNTVPSPLTVPLVSLAPAISCIRRTAEILSWKSSREDCWLLLVGWWCLCLFSKYALRCAR